MKFSPLETVIATRLSRFRTSDNQLSAENASENCSSFCSSSSFYALRVLAVEFRAAFYSRFGRAAPKRRPAFGSTKPISSYIRSSTGSDAFRAFSAPTPSSRWSSIGSFRSSS